MADRAASRRRTGEGPGNFRQHEITKFPGGMKPPSWVEVDALMRTWVTDNLHRFVIPAVAGPVKLVPLAALANHDITENALRVAATRGTGLFRRSAT